MAEEGGYSSFCIVIEDKKKNEFNIASFVKPWIHGATTQCTLQQCVMPPVESFAAPAQAYRVLDQCQMVNMLSLAVSAKPCFSSLLDPAVCQAYACPACSNMCSTKRNPHGKEWPLDLQEHRSQAETKCIRANESCKQQESDTQRWQPKNFFGTGGEGPRSRPPGNGEAQCL